MKMTRDAKDKELANMMHPLPQKQQTVPPTMTTQHDEADDIEVQTPVEDTYNIPRESDAGTVESPQV